MMVGLFEPRAAAWSVDGIPRDATFTTLKPDWDRMAPFLETAMARVPVTLEVGVRTFFCGPESFTPDLMPAVGEAPDLRNYFVAAGMNSVGVLSAGGLGRVHGALDRRRPARRRRHRVGRRPVPRRPARAGRTVASARPRSSARCTPPTRRASSCTRCATGCARPCTSGWSTNGGYLREVSGWEGADWFAGPGQTPSAEPTWGWAPWFDQWRDEHRDRPRRRRADGHVVHGEVRRDRRRRRRGARPPLGRRRRRRAGLDHLHPVAQRRRPDRGRPHRLQAGCRPLLGRRLRHRPRTRRRPARRGPRGDATSGSTTPRRRTPSSTCRGRRRATPSPP